MKTTAKKQVTLELTAKQFDLVKELADQYNLGIEEFIHLMAVLPLGFKKDYLSELDFQDAKNNLEEFLQDLGKNLEKQKSFVDLLLRSVYSTLLRLESQFKKYRIEASKELEKDIGRIKLIVDPQRI